MREGEHIFIRHGDKGKWQIDEKELSERLVVGEANMVKSVLDTEFPNLKETPITLDGIERSLRLADKLYSDLPKKSVLLVADSGKERAQITRSLITNRLAQLESKDESESGHDAKRVDMLQVEGEELAKLLADSSSETWPPYAKMIEDEDISENEAIARWLNDMNKPDSKINPAIHPAESAERYRLVVQKMRELVTSKHVPVVYFSVGHSGSLGQIKYEDQLRGQAAKAEDAPEFCEAFYFDNQAKLVRSERTSI